MPWNQPTASCHGRIIRRQMDLPYLLISTLKSGEDRSKMFGNFQGRLTHSSYFVINNFPKYLISMNKYRAIWLLLHTGKDGNSEYCQSYMCVKI